MATEKQTFQFVLSIDDLSGLGLEGLNDELDNQLDNAEIEVYATDISYRAIGATATGEVIIEATFTAEPKDEFDPEDSQ